MPLTVLDCCFCVSVRCGCIIIGLYNILYSVAKLSACVFLYLKDKLASKYKAAILSVVSVYCVLQLILGFFILLGVVYKNKAILKWSVPVLIALAVFSAAMILSFFWFAKEGRTFLVCCAVDVLLYYFSLVVFSYYVELKNEWENE